MIHLKRPTGRSKAPGKPPKKPHHDAIARGNAYSRNLLKETGDASKTAPETTCAEQVQSPDLAPAARPRPHRGN
jgi:hypothetical protein